MDTADGIQSAIKRGVCLAVDGGQTCMRTLKRTRCVGHKKGTCEQAGHRADRCAKHGQKIYQSQGIR